MSQEIPKEGIIVYTDGSARGNPGPGGYGAIVAYPTLDEVVELGGGKPHTTNNEMELSAVIAALSHCVMNTEIMHIFTDSRYVISGATAWIHGWKKNNWHTQNKEPVMHRALWEILASLLESRRERVIWHHVPGHHGVPGNERCDVLANNFAEGISPQLFRGRLSDYPYNLFAPLPEKKSSGSSSVRNAPAYSYLSVVDGVLERHRTWEECKARVHGKSAQYKKALSPEHEQEILKAWGLA